MDFDEGDAGAGQVKGHALFRDRQRLEPVGSGMIAIDPPHGGRPDGRGAGQTELDASGRDLAIVWSEPREQDGDPVSVDGGDGPEVVSDGSGRLDGHSGIGEPLPELECPPGWFEGAGEGHEAVLAGHTTGVVGPEVRSGIKPGLLELDEDAGYEGRPRGCVVAAVEPGGGEVPLVEHQIGHRPAGAGEGGLDETAHERDLGSVGGR